MFAKISSKGIRKKAFLHKRKEALFKKKHPSAKNFNGMQKKDNFFREFNQVNQKSIHLNLTQLRERIKDLGLR